MTIRLIQDDVEVLTVNLSKLSVSLCLKFMQVYRETVAVETDESRFAARKPKTRVVDLTIICQQSRCNKRAM
jgi:hypothetical protein